MLVWIVGILCSVGYFQWQYSYEYYFHWSIPGWTLIIVNSAMSITPPKIPSINLNVFIVNEYSYCVSGPWELNLTYPRVMEPTHMTEQCYAISDCIVVLGSLMSLSQLHHQIGISLHLTMATTLCHSRKLDVLTPSWYTFSPLSPSKSIISISSHFIGCEDVVTSLTNIRGHLALNSFGPLVHICCFICIWC